MPQPESLRGNPEEYSFDFVIVGGSPGGLSAALMAARWGLRVAVVHNRPMLGGNASSEIGVSSNITGAFGMGYNRYMRETGIVEDMKVKAFFEVHPHVEAMIENVFYDLAMRERPNLSLFLNTNAWHVETEGRKVTAIRARQIGSEREFRFSAPFFADCSGDGFLAAAAGNAFRYGREARGEFDEPMAPEEADDVTLGASLMFTVEEAGRPVPFEMPPWARKFLEEDAFPHRFHAFPGFGSWWCEHGGRLDPVRDHERIKAELMEIILGLFDHIKNRGPHGADSKRIVKIKPLVGRRESRRVEGRHLLTQHDLRPGNGFEDAVCFGGWPIDIHPPDGVLSTEPPAEQVFVEPYNIPLRTLVCRDLDNVAMAGRHVSITHAALGSTRVISTIASMGMAIGLATAMAHEEGKTYDDLIADTASLQQRLLRYDATILDIPNRDEDDLARTATVTASSSAPLRTGEPDYFKVFERPVGQTLQVTSGRLDRLTLFFKRRTAQPASVTVTAHPAAHRTDFGDNTVLAEATMAVDFDDADIAAVPFDLNTEVLTPFVRLAVTPSAPLYIGYTGREPYGVALGAPSKDGGFVYHRGYHDEDIALWRYERGCYSFELSPVSTPFAPENVTNGVSRFYRTPNIWISDPSDDLPAWIEFDLGKPQPLACIHLTFDTDLDHPHVRHADTLVRHYRVLADDGEWREVLRVRDNRRRKRIHNLNAPVEARRVRVMATASWGLDEAHIYEVRLYGEPDRFEL
jgi:hypothetical protein